MKSLIIIAIILSVSSCTQKLSDEERAEKLKQADFQTHKIMEDMDLPEYGVVKLIERKKISSKDFYQACRDLIKYGRQMKDVDHPEKKFNQLTEEMLSSFELFEEALASKNDAEVLKAWKIVEGTCKKCHDAYD